VHVRPVVKHDPFNAEASRSALSAAITPTASHYVRSNFATPDADTVAYRLALQGLDGASHSCTLDMLRALPQHDMVVTMECAGNDRLGLRPLPHGEPWGSGAVSTSQWRGVRLRDVLEGADHGPRDDAESAAPVVFARSVPLAVALHDDTLLALEMNGAPLTPSHGAPVRLVVPGWYGMANVKWVTSLSLRTKPFDGYFQTKRYVYDTGDHIVPVTRARVKSMITSPAEGQARRADITHITGWAWSGVGRITRVEVATAGGDDWQDATLGAPQSAYAWTPWSLPWSPPLGRSVLRSRATDETGAVQPDVPEWNRLGYGNNAVRPIVVDVLDPAA
jgi:DMSO/TMAO reductase YedYZ molybdopterin-dependent catalytic subunit